MDSALLAATKAMPDATRIEPFNGLFFKHWQQKIKLVMDISNVLFVLETPKPESDSERYEETLAAWVRADKICKSIILNSLSNELFDVYCGLEHALEIWNALVNKYVVEDAGIKKYAAANFLHFEMTDEKDVSSQIHEFHLITLELKNEGMELPEAFLTAALIEKLPETWREYKNGLKHKRHEMNLEQVIVHIRIEERNRLLARNQMAKQLTVKANVVEDRPKEFKPKGGAAKSKYNQQYTHPKPHGQTFKKKGGG
ncbi:hypothetical protein Vadar_007401 [Vaccinium darrowii]|uniref:Uncharacterized protein n=1 Tax=Vaccinium darrowii TaxID=229202 RepID=A0ACB7XNX7_9ERIC|nr:hypothetical protein Vadar_007401 [Vaccinium darrowii]